MKIKIPSKASKIISKAALKTRKASPAILIALGIGAMIGGTVLACKAARKMDEPIDEARKEIDAIHEMEAEDELFSESKESTRKKLKVWAKLLKRMVILFAPAGIAIIFGIVSILGGHNLLYGRYLGLAAANSALMQEASITNAKLMSEQSKTVDPKTGEISKEPVTKFAPKVEYYYSQPDENSLTPMGAYAFKFDKDHCPGGAHGSYEIDRLSALQGINYLNTLLLDRSMSGYIFYDRCLSQFGFVCPDTQEGRQFLAMSKSVGWMREDGKEIMMNGTRPTGSCDPCVITAYDPYITASGDKLWKKYVIIDPMCYHPNATYFGPILERIKTHKA